MAHWAKSGSISELKLKHKLLFQCFLIEKWFVSTEKSKVNDSASLQQNWISAQKLYKMMNLEWI